MTTVTISPKYQVVIPKDIRRKMKLKSGQKLQVIAFGARIEFLPVTDIRAFRGIVKGMDTTVKRDKDRT